jgi:rhamnulokinase
MKPTVVTAVDVGASAGRVIVGRVGPDELQLSAVHRFVNEPVEVLGTLHWNILGIFGEVLAGLRMAAHAHAELASVGVDSWGCDYGLLDSAGRLLGNPIHYRDVRTREVAPRVVAALGPDYLYDTTGLQLLPFNTIYQLVASAESGLLDGAHTVLLLPDLLSYWLTGVARAEYTNASTTQLLDVHRRQWARVLIERAGLPERIFPPVIAPGDRVGDVLPSVAQRIGLDRALPVTAVGTHDTASAVVAVPASDERFLYISCGTWSLVGQELDQPVLSQASRLANFTNEAGVDGTIRHLRNVMGLWILQESLRKWEAAGVEYDLTELLAAAAAVQPFSAVFDCDDAAFLAPGDMPSRIADACRRTGQAPPHTPAQFTRCILESLAIAYRRAVQQASEITDRDITVIHLVGGGARNALLCQLTADACGIPVIAGPVEATALGNILIQARAVGAIAGELTDLRAMVAANVPVERYEPRGNEREWAAAAGRLDPRLRRTAAPRALRRDEPRRLEP